jgi:hypothetical protein
MQQSICYFMWSQSTEGAVPCYHKPVAEEDSHSERRDFNPF